MLDFQFSSLDILASTAITTTITGLVLFLFRNYFSKWIESRFAEKAQVRLAELEALISKKQSEINDIRQFIISGKLKRNEALMERQIQAAEALWIAMLSDKRHSFLVALMQSMKIEEIDKQIKTGSLDEWMTIMSEVSGFQNFMKDVKAINPDERRKPSISAQQSRPFVSPLAFALYTAHERITGIAVAIMLAWTSNMDTKLLKLEEVKALAIAALPHQKPFLEKYGVGGTFYLLEELEEKLLAELRRFLNEGDSDQSLLDQANAILKSSIV